MLRWALLALSLVACSDRPLPGGRSRVGEPGEASSETAVAATPAATTPTVARATATTGTTAATDDAVITAGAAPARTGPPRGSADALSGPEIPVGEGCAARGAVTLFVSPVTPRAGTPLRIVAVSSRPLPASPGALAVRTPQGGSAPLALTRGGGPPWWWTAEIASPVAGSYRAALGQGSDLLACKDIQVADAADVPSWRAPPGSAAWRSTGTWTGADEDLYSAWIERLFDAPLAEQPSWSALHEVLRDRGRNFLHGHLGQGEDDPPPRGLSLDPDCADLPYFLRAYFAFKLGLPFGFSACTRGGPGAPPGCGRFRSSDERPTAKARSAVQAFNHFLRVTVADTVHSGSGRVPSTSDEGDYYPVTLTAESLRPGTIYADPYGHVLMVAKRLPQTTEAGGVLLAVDGQPDGTVARRRYWRGNFLFALDPSLGGPGFKRFRPLVRERGRLRRLTNDEIAAHAAYGDVSREQHLLGVEGFYDKVDAVLSPAPLDPQRALLETVQALEEQVRGRVLSVKNGQDYLARGNASIDMPKGAEIFETVGPWEDFSTPSRDLRLLIAIDVVRKLPARVERLPTRYAMPPGKSPAEVRAELEGALARELKARRITYPRSDGSEQTLTLSDVVARAETLEMAYNPNDCAEVRWGAPEGSDEARTCARRAPWSQRIKMQRYRGWFRDRLRPPRG